MHPVLQIPEVLLNIFCRHVPSGLSEEDRKCVYSDLAALARTCRAFKEPALDILWSELHDPSPLSRCLPEISHQIVTGKSASRKFYSFTRPLERAEWDILHSYTRRVWCIRDLRTALDWKSVRTSMDFTPADPLFPNLRTLHCEFAEEIIPLLHLPFPSLIRLNCRLPSKVDLRMLQDPLRSLAKASPNIRRLDIWDFYQHKLAFTKIVSDGICGWSNLQWVTCPGILLDVDALVHLSRMPSLARLTFTLSPTFLAQTNTSGSPSFTTLNYLKLHARSLVPISRLLSWACLPSITDFTITIDNCPPKQDLAPFMAGLQKAGMGHAIQEFNLKQVHDAPDTIPPRWPDAPLLDLDDLRPCMAFHNIRRMNLNLQWDVDLSDAELLTLASAWPQLEELLINENWGWNRPGGITPNGLALLLQRCPSLNLIALAIDTRGHTQLRARRYQGSPSASAFARSFHINILDSVIEEESVDAMVVSLTSIVPSFRFILTAWETWSVLEHPYSDLYRERWEDVHSRANDAIKDRWLNFLRGMFFQSVASESLI